MNTKQFGLFFVGIFALVLTLGVVSAATIANWNVDANTTATSGSGTLTVSDSRTSSFPSGNAPTATGSLSVAGWDVANRYIELSVSTSGYQDITLKLDEQKSTTGPTAFQIQYSTDGTTFVNLGSTTATATAFTTNPMHTFTFSTVTALNNNANAKFRILVPSGSLGTDSAGTLRLDNILVEGTATTTPSEITSCSTTGNPGQLEVRSIDFSNQGMPIGTTFGEDEEWFPFEEVEVEIEVKNNGNDDVEDVSVEWGLWNVQTGEWVIDLDEADELNIKDGDRESMTVSFTLDDDMDVDLEDLTDGNDYRLYVIATGTVDNSTAPETCVSDYETASVIIENNFVVVNNVDMPAEVQCNSDVDFMADVWNVGDEDQDDVTLYVQNTELGIDEEVTVGDIDAFDSMRVPFTLSIPSGVSEKTYALLVEVYDEDNDLYENDYDEDTASFTLPLKVSGCSGSTTSTNVIASLVSGGNAGGQMVVKATVTNGGTTMKTYNVNIAGYADWASSASADSQTLVLNAGQSKDVTVTLDVNKDASGEKSFYLELVSGSEVVRQPVSTNIESSSLFGFTGKALSQENLPWAIGILNLVLIVIIVFVAVRIARK